MHGWRGWLVLLLGLGWLGVAAGAVRFEYHINASPWRSCDYEPTDGAGACSCQALHSCGRYGGTLGGIVRYHPAFGGAQACHVPPVVDEASGEVVCGGELGPKEINVVCEDDVSGGGPCEELPIPLPTDPTRLGESAGKPLRCVGNPCDPVSGNKFETERDYRGSPGGLRFDRYYSSLAAVVGVSTLGRGWSHSYSARLLVGAAGEIAGQLAALRDDGRRVVFLPLAANPPSPERWVGRGGEGLVLRRMAWGWRLTRADGTEERYAPGGRLASIADPGGGETRLRYGEAGPAAGRLVEVREPFGLALRMEYEDAGGVGQVRLRRLVDPAGAVVGYDYDSSGRLTGATFQDGTSRAYRYEAVQPHLLTGIVDESGVRFATFEYHPDQRVRSTERAGGTLRHALEYDDESSTTTVIGPLGAVTRYAWAPGPGRAAPGRIEHPAGVTERTEYDALRRPERTVDIRGAVTERELGDVHERLRREGVGTSSARETRTSYRPDGDSGLPLEIVEDGIGAGSRVRTTTYVAGTGRPETIRTAGIAPDGSEVVRMYTRRYDEHGRLSELDGPRTEVADVTYIEYYDDCPSEGHCGRRGRPRLVRNALGHTTRFEGYDAHGRLARRVDPNGLVTELEYDARGRLVASTEIAGERAFATRLERDARGLVLRAEGPDGSGVRYEHDSAQRLVRITDAAGHVELREHDAAGNVVLRRLSSEGSVYREDRYRRDLAGRLAERDSAGALHAWHHDAAAGVEERTDPRGGVTREERDVLGRLVRRTDALGGVTTFGYDAAGRIAEVVDPLGRATRFEHDDLGNLVRLESPAAGVTRYTHDAAGNVVSRLDARAVLSSFEYDELGRLTALRFPSGAEDVTFGYDDPTVNGIGRLVRADDADGVTKLAYDVRGNLEVQIRQTAESEFVTRYGYDAMGRIAEIVYPSGLQVRHRRDANGAVIGIDADVEGESIAVASEVLRSTIGPARRWVLGNGLEVLRDHDSEARAISLSAQSVLDIEIRRDVAGNVEALIDHRDAARSREFAYDMLDRVLVESGPFGTREFAYDRLGNRTAVGVAGASVGLFPDGALDLHYGERNRLLRVERGGSPVGEYAYDGWGRRIGKHAFGERVAYHYGTDGALLAESAASGEWHRDYVYLDGEPIATVLTGPPARVYYYHGDQLGTPLAMTDESGAVVWRADYTAFGSTEIAIEAVPNNLRFPGQYFDAESGLHYNYFRDYDPTVGRYTQSDPIGLGGGVNPYAYAGGNPLLSTDRLGLLRWRGSFFGGSASEGVGGVLMRFDLVSECVEGEEAAIEVVAVGPEVSVGLPVTETGGKIEFEDGASSIEPDNFDGPFLIAQAAASVGRGFASGSIRLGGAYSVPERRGLFGLLPFDAINGIDGTIGIGTGRATVVGLRRRACECR